ncbi:MAG TPA: GNAT family protein [Candidatus Paceibacterota bacterium]
MFISQEMRSEKVMLRPFKKSDIELWDVWDRDTQVQEYMPEPQNVLTCEEQGEYFNECESRTDEVHAAIVNADTQTCIGTIAVTDINEHHGVGELGMVIGDKNVWNKGYGNEALGLFIEYIKTHTKVRRISAECEEDNIGMQKVLEKNQFMKECVKKESRVKKGRRINTVQYSILLEQ